MERRGFLPRPDLFLISLQKFLLKSREEFGIIRIAPERGER
jgi:hypothetical protein